MSFNVWFKFESPCLSHKGSHIIITNLTFLVEEGDGSYLGNRLLGTEG